MNDRPAGPKIDVTTPERTLTRPFDGSEQLAGLLMRALEHGLLAVKHGDVLLPIALIVINGQRGLTRFVGDSYDEAIDSARQHVSGAHPDRWAVVYDGYATFPEGRFDVVIVEGGERGAGHAFRLVQRYERATPAHPIRLLGNPTYLGWVQQLVGTWN